MRDTRGPAARRLSAIRTVSRPGAVPASSSAGRVATPEGAGSEGTGSEGLPGEVELPDVAGRSVRPVAVAAAAAAAVIVAVVAWVHSQGAGESVQLAPRVPAASASPAGGAVGVAAASSTPAAIAASPSPVGVVVDVEGRVRRPGLQRLPGGARVADAVRAAGGTTAGAVVSALNLARLLSDGEQVVVPGPGDSVRVPGPAGSTGSPGSSGSAGSASAGSVSGPAAPVDLNSATQDGLDALPGIGPVLAQRIITWRTQHGRYTSVDELAEVPGIGPKALERLRPLVRV
jgi:competence protein ComEA